MYKYFLLVVMTLSSGIMATRVVIDSSAVFPLPTSSVTEVTISDLQIDGELAPRLQSFLSENRNTLRSVTFTSCVFCKSSGFAIFDFSCFSELSLDTFAVHNCALDDEMAGEICASLSHEVKSIDFSNDSSAHTPNRIDSNADFVSRYFKGAKFIMKTPILDAVATLPVTPLKDSRMGNVSAPATDPHRLDASPAQLLDAPVKPPFGFGQADAAKDSLS